MFLGCTALKGENGTKYSDRLVSDISFAKKDDTTNEGYFTSEFYTFNVNWDTWHRSITRGTQLLDDKLAKNSVTKISFIKNPTPVPTSFNYMWQIPSSNGLKGYIVNSTELIIYSDMDLPIYAAEDMHYALSGGTTDRCYTNVEEIVNLNYLNTERVTNMQAMFMYCQKLRSVDLSNFVTASVSTMRSMFYQCKSITNLDLTTFDTSNVLDMAMMFRDCTALQSVDLSSFDTSKCEYMTDMFRYCESLPSIDLSMFDTGNVISMAYMFEGCKILKPLDVTGFNTSKVTQCHGMFKDCISLETLDVSNFDTRNVRNMHQMFQGMTNLRNIDILHFDTGNVVSFEYLFADCATLSSIDISNLDTKNVTTMTNMFSGCTRLTMAKLNDLTNDRLTDVSYMFRNCPNLSEVDFDGFDTSHITNMMSMFQNDTGLIKLNLKEFDTSRVTNMRYMFSDCTNLETIYVSRDWTNARLNSTGRRDMFTNCSNLKGEKGTTIADVVASGVSATNATYGTYAIIDEGLTSGTPGYLTLLHYILAPTWYDNATTFTSKTNINSIKFLNYDDATPSTPDFTFSVLDSNGLIGYIVDSGSGSSSPYDIYIYPPEDYKIYADVNSSYLFSDSNPTNVFTALSTISNINYIDTSKVVNMSYMFYSAGLEEFDGTQFDTSNVSDMTHMFSNMPNIIRLNIKNFDTNNVAHMSYMFSNNPNLQNIDVGNIDTSNVIMMDHMFENNTNLKKLQLGSFDTANVYNMSYMFNNCISLKTIMVTSNFVTTGLFNNGDIDMFNNCTVLEGGNGTKYADKLTSDATNAKRKKYALIDGYQNKEGYFTEKYYVFSNNWAKMNDRRIYDSTYNKSDVASISFVKTPETAPTTYHYKWDLPDSNGLLGYVIDSATAGLYDIIVYAPEDLAIYTSEIAKFMFSVDTTNDNDRFVNCKEIKNLNYLNTNHSTDFDCMFIGMRSLQSLDLSGFDTSNVTTMMNTFQDLRSIKTLDLSSFNVENVETMYSMFEDCRNLERIIFSDFNTRNLTRAERMFYNDEKLTALDLSTFNTTNVINMSSMFYNCKAMMNLDLSSFNTSNVTTMTSMFYGMEALTTLNVLSFDTRNLTAAGYNNMFNGLKNIEELNLYSFSSNLSYINPQRMFYNDEKLKTIYVSNNFPAVRSYATDMFYNCQVLVGGSGTRWADQSGVNQINGTFALIDTPTTPGYFTLFNFTLTRDWTGDNTSQYIGVAPNISTYTKNNIEEITFVKYPETTPSNANYSWNLPGSKGLKGYIYDNNKIMIYAPIVADIYAATNSDALFSSLSGNDKVFKNVKRINNLTYLNTSKVEKMTNMFKDMQSLESLDLSNFNTASVSEIESMFRNCYAIQNLDLSSFDTQKVISTAHMFRDCRSLTSVDISNFDLRSATTFANMFTNCRELLNLDFSNKNTISLTNVGGMFNGCTKLKTLNLKNINTSGVTTMAGLFNGLSSIEKLDLGSFDTSNVTNMQGMFSGMTSLKELNLKNFDTSHVSNMRQMFYQDSNLRTILALPSFDTSAVTNGANMFEGCTSLIGGQGTKYVDIEVSDPGQYNTVQYALIDGLGGNQGYFTMFNYVLTNEWSGSKSSEFIGVAPNVSTYTKGSIREITIATYPVVAPATYDYTWELPGSYGLTGYVYDTNKIMIHAPLDYPIYADIDSSYLFSQTSTDTAKTFSNVESIVGLRNLHTERTTNMKSMFANMENLVNIDFSIFNTENVTDMSSMFLNLKNITNLNIESFDTSNVTDMSQMFKNVESITKLNVKNFDTNNVVKMAKMFEGCTHLTTIYATTNFSTSNLTDDGVDMFNNCLVLDGGSGTTYADKNAINPTTAKNKTFAYLDGLNGIPGYFREMIYVLTNDWTGSNSQNYIGNDPTNLKSNITKISFVKTPLAPPTTYVDTWDIPDSDGLKGYLVGNEVIIYAEKDLSIYASTDASYLFSSNGGTAFTRLTEIASISELNTKKCKNMSNMFYNCQMLSELNLSTFDTSNVTDMSHMFDSCFGTNSIDISSFNTLNVTNMSYMFANMVYANTIDVSSFDTRNVVDMSYMYLNCILPSIDLHNFNTASVSDMSHMFDGCLYATDINVTSFDTSNVVNMQAMFRDCESLSSIDVTGFDTSKVTTMESLFEDCEALTTLDLSFFNTRKVLNMANMFNGLTNLVTLHGTTDFVVTQVIDDTNMFLGCDSLDGGAGTTYMANYTAEPLLAVTKQFAWIDGHLGRPGYFDGILKLVKVNLRGNGGIYSDGNEDKIDYIQEFTSTALFEEPVRPGFAFDKYIVNDEEIHEVWDYGQFVNDVIATWKPSTYKIIYNANGGVGQMDVNIATYGETYIIRDSLFTKDGYTFAGWSYEGNIYQKDDEVSNLTTVSGGEVILEAIWNPKTYRINYLPNGGTGSMPTEIATYGIDYTTSTNKYQRDGYTFNGWSLSKDSDVSYGNSAIIFANEEYREEINLYAKWIKTDSIYGELKLMGNGGYINGVSTFTRYYRENEVINDVTKYRKGYSFKNWIDTSDVIKNYPMICDFSGETVLKANWGEDTYKIIYHANNDTLATYEENILKSATSHLLKSISELSYTKTNYKFSGWSMSANDDTISYIDGADIGNINKDEIHLYAVWTGNTYTIVLNEWDKLAVGANRNKIETFTYGDNKNIKRIATNSYVDSGITYLFKGWAEESSTTMSYFDSHYADIIYEELGNGLDNITITLDSLWVDSSMSVNLVFDGNEGTINGKKKIAVTLAIGDTIPYPNSNKDLYKKNNKPVGWLDTDRTTPFNDTLVLGFIGTKTIYVSWTDRDCNYNLKYVSLEKDATSPTMAPEIKACSEEFNLTSNKFTRLGYDFIGWDTSEDAKTVVYKENEKVKELADVDDTITLYAVWRDKTYTIRFYDANDNYLGYKTFTYNGTTTIMTNVVSIGKTDAGYIYKDGSMELKFYSGQRVSKYAFNITSASNVFDLYGCLADKIYIATFDGSGGVFTDGKSVRKISITYGANINYPSVKRNNYTFTNWLLNGVIFNESIWNFDDDMMFVASWNNNEEKKDDDNRNYSGGGGGGGSSNVSIDRNIPLVMETPIYENEYTFIYDSLNNIIGVALNNESKVAKALFNSYFTKDNYQIIGNTNTIKLLNGMYKIRYGGTEHYFAFDKYGNMITGFAYTSERTKILRVADNIYQVTYNNEILNLGYKLTPDTVFFEKVGEVAEYYLYEQVGPNRGVMWKEPIVVNGITYIFDVFGKVISSFATNVSQGIWEYNPSENKWRYFVPDTDGKITYYKDCMEAILYNGNVYTYAFDENGYMQVGNFIYKGNAYYAEENGMFKGSVLKR